MPYKGGGQAIIDLMAGHVQTGFVNILEALPQVNAGRLRALAVSTSKRSPVAPSIPTVAEAGVAGYEVIQWSGVLGPAGLPKAVTLKLNEEIVRILARPDMRQRLHRFGRGSRRRLAGAVRRAHQVRDREVVEGREDRQARRGAAMTRMRSVGKEEGLFPANFTALCASLFFAGCVGIASVRLIPSSRCAYSRRAGRRH